MNEVEVDEAALAAEAEAVNVPGGDAQGGPDVEVLPDEAARAEQFAQRALPVVRKLVVGLSGAFAPNWQVSAAQHDELAGSVAYALALWFPHEIPPKYAALLMVGASVYGIAESNRDAEGHIRPLRKREPPMAGENGDSPAA